MRCTNKITLYISKRMVLPVPSIALIAKFKNRWEAEKLYLFKIKLQNRANFIAWHRTGCKLCCKPVLLNPTYKWFVTDAVNSFELECDIKFQRNGGHNYCSRRDIWFRDWDGNKWWGVHLAEEYRGGEFSNELVHCKKLKCSSY